MYFLYHEGNPEDPLMSEIRKQNSDLDEIDTRYQRALSDDDVWVAADRRRMAEMTYKAITDFAIEEGEARA